MRKVEGVEKRRIYSRRISKSNIIILKIKRFWQSFNLKKKVLARSFWTSFN